MPIIKSAKKRVRTARKATVRNSKTKRTLRGALKAFAGKITADNQSKTQSAIDIAVKKGVMHKNKAARLKKRAAAEAKAAKTGIKKTVKKVAPVKKAVAKKPAAKKTPAKKK